MKTTEDKIKYVIKKHPNVKGDNTKFYIKFCEVICKLRNEKKTWRNIKDIMQIYKPENIMRKRREVVNSTEAQREKEQEYHNEYS